MISHPSLWIASLLFLLVITFWISWVDARHLIIPDAANVSLGLGGLFSTWASDQSTAWRMFEMALAGVCLWALRWAYTRLRGKVGLGLGDVKFAAAATAWTGLLALPWLILLASLSALASLAILQISGRVPNLHARIPFGPHLGVGLLVTWLALSYGYL
jgi:leader peptidase (prepilin peptidase) / N-methyltransferase